MAVMGSVCVRADTLYVFPLEDALSLWYTP